MLSFRSLRAALLAVGSVGVLAALMVLAIALWSFRSLDHSATAAMAAKDVVADVLPPPMYLIEMRLVLSQAVEGSLPVAEARRQVDTLAEAYAQRVAYWQSNPPPERLGEPLLGAQHAAAQAFIDAARQQVLAPLARGDEAAAREGLQAAHRRYAVHRTAVDETVKAGTRVADASMATFEATTVRGSWTLPAVTGVLLVVLVASFALARRSILTPLQRCMAVADRVAAGDLTHAAPADRDDEIGHLQQALARMTTDLAGTVGQVRQSVEAIASASAEIAAGNVDLSRRTEHQAAHVQQTASSLEQMAQAVRANAEHAHGASRLASSASHAADESGRAVSEVIATMAEIHDASRRIQDIIGVIEGIASQTNILALNAAVEAARAGEHGRGFAIVATEVRGLAQRSAEAAKEIKSLVIASGERIDRGHALVGDAGDKMRAVVEQVGHLTGLITGISSASGEQRDGVQHLNAAVNGIDHSTQQNAGLVEETAAAAESLRTQSQRLVQAMAAFRLPGAA